LAHSLLLFVHLCYASLASLALVRLEFLFLLHRTKDKLIAPFPPPFSYPLPAFTLLDREPNSTSLMRFLLLQFPNNEPSEETTLAALRCFRLHHMHIHHLLHPFEKEFDLPSCTIELNNSFIGPRTLWKVSDEQHPSYKKKRVKLELLSFLLSFLFPLFSSLCCFFW
jgi:hypothetical protein